MKALTKFLVPGLDRRRAWMTIIGVLVCGFGVALCRMARFGVDSFQSFCSGVYLVTPDIPQGTMYILINGLLLLFSLVFDRHYIGLGTLINLFLLGYVVDGSEQLLLMLFGEPTFIGQLVYLILGLAVISVSCSLYITADLGVSTYDAIALYIAAHGKLHYRWVRIITDVLCVAIGWMLGSVPGVCTILCASLLGPAIAWLNPRFSQPLLYGKSTIPE